MSARRRVTSETFSAPFDPGCRRCPRLSGFLSEVKSRHPAYHCAPVAPFGDADARLLIVGLAPGLHGANATGRPFTGDHAGIILYKMLHRYGYSSREASVSATDGLTLQGCRISNAVKCLPPENKPTPEEIRECNRFLAVELQHSASVRVLLALGRIAHEAVLRALSLKARDYAFAHGAVHELPEGRTLVDSYHCSRYNTQTGRLTEQSFAQIFDRIATLR